MRLKQLAEPAGEVGLFEHEVLLGGGNGLRYRGSRRESAVAQLSTLGSIRAYEI
jgi:hypothetical protein